MKYIKSLKLGLLIITLVLMTIPYVSIAQGSPYEDTGWQLQDEGFGNPNSGNSTNSNSGGSGSSSSSSGGGCDLGTNPKFDGLIKYITCIISISVIPLIFVLAFMLFIWGVVQYVINDTEEAKREKGKQFMLWGIIALFVMFSVWGLVAVLGNTFGIEYVIPQVAD